MKEFFSYFFGIGEEIEFTYFSWAHILPIIFMLGVITLIIVFRNKIKNFKHEKTLRLALAFLLIITEMSYFWRLVGVESLNANPTDHLPITVCGWAIIFCSYLVVTKSQSLFDIAYFWVLAGSTFGLLTPTKIMYCGPTRFRYYQFWLEHILGFIVLAYMMAVHGMRPNIKSIFKSYGAMLVLGVIAMIANSMLPDANYLFIAKTEDSASILDILPKNDVVRVILMAIIVAVLFFLVYLPWLIIDIKRKKLKLSPVTDTPVHATTEPLKIASNKSSKNLQETVEITQPEEKKENKNKKQTKSSTSKSNNTKSSTSKSNKTKTSNSKTTKKSTTPKSTKSKK